MSWKPYGLITGVVFMVTACSETSQLAVDGLEGSDSVSGKFLLSVPASIATARAVNLDALFARVLVNGEEQAVPPGSNTVTFSAENGGTLNISVTWFETQDDRADDLMLASWATSETVNGNLAISVDTDDYISDGEAFDADNDEFSNLAERKKDSDPYNPDETPDNVPDVRLRWVNPAEAPAIDGLYDAIWSDRAKFNDVSGERLSIDNLMINQGALQANGAAQFRWFAMHDDNNLYVYVIGKNDEITTPIRDSSDPWQDDTVNLFIDGNNSKGDSYDGFDDRHLYVPLLTSPDNLSSNSTLFVNSEFSAPEPEFEFATCLCTGNGEITWEFRLPFSEFNITKNVPFGFDIQIDVDNDGGARDARWGWFHPARTSEDVDNTRMMPSFMGTVIVE
ncbi:MAG: sugar-binding protein [Granulosicoccus sp.]